MKGPSGWPSGMILLPMKRDVALEAQGCFAEQLRGHGQVGLGTRQIDVAQVGGEQGKARLYVGSFAVPGDEPGHGKGMSNVMQARLPTVRIGPPDPGMLAQPHKDLLELGERDGTTRAGTEEGR